MEVFKKHGTKERLFEMMKNVNKGLIKEDFDYHGAEMDHLGQQDLDAHNKEEESKNLATLLKSNPNDFNQTISTLQEIPAYVQSGNVLDSQMNPLALGFRDLEQGGLVSVQDANDPDHDDIPPTITVTSEIPIYGIDTQKLYKKGETIV